MNDRSSSDPLADLERRWAEEKSPQVTLHLAEEYRRAGDVDRAIEMLREGLEHHPKHVAARVALGRFLLESGKAAAAAAALESVADDDPTHLVANKLLVTAAVELGEVERARNRLGLYQTLNPSDPEIEDLEARLERLASGADHPGVAAEDGEEGASEVASQESTERLDLRVQDEPTPERGDQPFAGLWGELDDSAYRAALAEEGIFEFAGAPEEVPEEVPVEPREATVTLGRLYLEQGHSAEAEVIFRAVLERQPDNLEARRGLMEALGERPRLTASELVAPSVLEAARPHERKSLVLESYRERLRSSVTEE